MLIQKVSIGRGANPETRDCHGEELVAYPCNICTGFDLPSKLIVIHSNTARLHEYVHEFCAVARELPWTRCDC